MLRHVFIMKTSESDSAKKLILAISTNTRRYLLLFVLSERIYIDIEHTILKNEQNEVEFLQVFIPFSISASPPPVHRLSNLQNNLSLHLQNMDHIFFRVNTTSLYLHLNN